MTLDRLWFNSAKAHIWQWWLDEVVHAPLEPILHPSRTRLQWLGAFTLMGQALFAWIWGVYLPQPYENIYVRVFVALLGVPLLLDSVNRDLTSKICIWVFGVVFWLQLPVFFSWMYWMNDGNRAWLASVAAMLLIYYHITDWRLATLGSVAGLGTGFFLFVLFQPQSAAIPLPFPDMTNVVVIAFSWSMSLMLGLSSANLRRTRLLNTLSTIGVMAHELRTPLATVNLMSDVLRNLAKNDIAEGKRRKIEDLADRLQSLVKSMNRQIDTQISNAQLQRLPSESAPVLAAELVQDVVNNYPYRTSRERECVQVVLLQDFCFLASRPLFAQVLSNLVKNALHSLASASTAPSPGDLRIDIGLHRGKGRIAVSDEGLGIAHDKQRRIFEPFFSTQAGAGNGLGLTFCKNVVEAAHGQLSVHSEPGLGAVFMIDLPLSGAHPMTPHTSI